jgi:hypothetical protein
MMLMNYCLVLLVNNKMDITVTSTSLIKSAEYIHRSGVVEIDFALTHTHSI